jgi:hypothetical protein
MESPEPFTAEDAAGADARQISELLASRGYQNFYEPLMIATIRVWSKQLADPSAKRKWAKPDDYLRGGIKVLEALLAMPHDIIAQQTAAARLNDEAETVEQHYDRIARDGRGLPGESPYGDEGISPTDPI